MLNIHKALTPRLLGVAVAAAALISPSLASAQDVPSYASANAGADQQIQGTISSINDTWNITVADANGYSDSVELHQGTIINPTGLTLEQGMSVTIDGYADGPNFDAMEIDTPYQYQGPAPVAVYYGPGAWYPGYAYGWGPSFSLFFDFGSHSWAQRSFAYGGQVRRPMAPPAGWQDRPHGYIGNSGSGRVGFSAPQRTFAASQNRRFPTDQTRAFAAPQQHAYVAPQQTRDITPSQRYVAPQQQRSFAAPQQSRNFTAPQARSYAAAPQARSYAAPQRSDSAPQRSYSAPRAASTPHANQSGDHRRG